MPGTFDVSVMTEDAMHSRGGRSTETISVPSSVISGLTGSKALEFVQRKKDFGFLPIPRRLRYNPDKPIKFGLAMNALFGFAGTFVVANLYYCQPLLIQLASSFHVDYSEVSNIPTLLQGGYATGLLLLTPLGDLVPRRPLLLSLSFIAAGLTIGLSITKSLVAFEILCFLVGAFSVSGQILIPLAADLAPPERRATAISIVISGLLLGVLIARVFSGIIAEFATWRVVYYLAIGMQYLVLFLLWVMLPDYPAKNVGLSYFDILWSMAKLAFTEPELIQASLITIASSACFTTFWVTLTFLLGGPLYNFSTLAIGLFGLIGIGGVCMAPIAGRVIDRMIPWYATLFSTLMLLATLAIYTGAAGENVAAVVIVTIGIDVFRQMQQTSLTTAVLAIDESARSRINAVIILSFFIGTVMGTPVGSRVFLEHGWRAAGGLMLAWVGWQLAMLFLRGPQVGRHTWVGWSGGMEWRKDVVKARKEQQRQQDESGAPEYVEEASGEQDIDMKVDEKKSDDVLREKDVSAMV